MRGEPWSQAELDWLRERWPTMSAAEIVESYPGSFPIRTPMALQSKANSLGLHKAYGYGGRRTWTPEADAWLREYAPGHSVAEIVSEARERLGMELSTYAVKYRLHKLGLKTGVNRGRFRPGYQPYTKGVPRSEWMSPEAIERCRRTQFAKGQAAHNTAPVGSERVNSAGVVEVKVAEKPFGVKAHDNWVPKARIVWEREHGEPWPDGCRCVFADHDKLNLDPENIVPVPQRIYPIVSGCVTSGLAYHDRESLDVAMAYAEVVVARRGLQMGRRDGGGR